jgi:hypothetical protein
MDKEGIICFVVAMIAAFTLSWLLGAEHTGGKPKIGLSLILYKGGNACLHIHHWMYMAALAVLMTVVILLSKGTFNPAIMGVYGALLGASLTGLRYSDFLQVKVVCSAEK